MSKPGDWMENSQNLANIGHALGGAFVLHVAVMFSRNWWPVLVVEVLLAAYVLIKEYWYDLKYETGETMKSSTIDALGYLVGTVIEWGLIGLAHHLGTWHFLPH